MNLSLLLIAALMLAAVPARAGVPVNVIYSGLQNLSIPQSLGGLYLDVVSGTTSIGSSDLLRPNITGSSQVLNLAVSTVIDSSRTYAAAESGSTTHVGAGGTQFQLGAQGLLGFVMQKTTGGPLFYGWMRIIIDNTGSGTLMDWAYEDNAGNSIPAGFTGTTTVPEPGRAVLLLLGLMGAVVRRRR
jgi:hypothetical protein